MNLKLIAGNYGRTLKKEKKLKWPYQKIFSQSINFPSYSSVTLLKKKTEKVDVIHSERSIWPIQNHGQRR